MDAPGAQAPGCDPRLWRRVFVKPIPVGGLRISPALAQINVAGGSDSGALLADYLHRLAQRHINLPFLSLSSVEPTYAAAFCVTANEGDRARDAAMELPRLVSRITVLSPVTAVSVFPHHGRLRLLGHLLKILHEEHVPLLAMGSSISSFTFTLAQRSLEQTVDVLEQALALPENHTPLRSQLQVIQVEQGELE